MRKLALFLLLTFSVSSLVSAPLSAAPAPNMPPMKGNVAVLGEEGSPVCAAVALGPQTVLTAAHCVEEASAATVRCAGEDIPAEVVKRDADEDLATLDLLFDCEVPYVSIARTDPKPGEEVYALGYPHGSARISKGLVSGYEAMDMPEYDGVQHKKKIFLATDAAGDPGSSGGGLFDSNGELVGICSMGRGNFAYFSPPKRIRRFLGLQTVGSR